MQVKDRRVQKAREILQRAMLSTRELDIQRIESALGT